LRNFLFSELEHIARELNPVAERQSRWIRANLAADTEAGQINDAMKEMDEAFNVFMVGASIPPATILMSNGVSNRQDFKYSFEKA
jgi:hypothetical protein